MYILMQYCDCSSFEYFGMMAGEYIIPGTIILFGSEYDEKVNLLIYCAF